MGVTISDPDDRYRYVRYGLAIERKAGVSGENLQIATYWNPKMQALGFDPDYTAQTRDRLNGDDADPSLDKIRSSWSFPVDLADLAADESIRLDDFYQLLVHIRWDGGREWVRMDHRSVSAGTDVDTTPLLQQDLDSMVKRGLQIANQR